MATGKIPTTAKMGIDATIPENVPANRYNRIVYFNQGRVQLKDYIAPGAKQQTQDEPAMTMQALSQNILSELERSHRFFAELLELFPDAGYRTIATAIGALHEQGKILQDSEGKYQAK
jgi:2,5-furandicarboxylate decarboxylase 1